MSRLRWPPVALTGAPLTAAVLSAVVLLVVGAPPAVAHNALSSTSPAQRETVPRTPTEVVLTFDEPAIAMGTQVVVTGPTGPVQQGAPRLVDETVSQTLQPGAPAGTYTVTWRVTSSDGHPISDSYTFTSEAVGAGTPPVVAPTPAGPVAPTATPAPPWVWWIGATVALLAAAGVLRWIRRRTVG